MINAKRSIVNIITIIITDVLVLSFGIIVPRYILLYLGSESNGLIGSITTILSYLTLLELGVGTASLQALYHPIALKDTKQISEIVAATGVFYKRTGVIYFIIVLLIAIIYPLTVSSIIPKITIAVVILFNGLPSALSYYYQGKYTVLLSAEGRSYINSIIASIATILFKSLEIILLVRGFGLILIQAVYFAICILRISALLLYVRKHYSWIDRSAKCNFEAVSQSGNAMVHQVASMICNNTDVIVLTYFCDLRVVSVYVLYRTLFNCIQMILEAMSGVNFALGQLFAKDRASFIKIYDVYEVLFISLTCSLFSIATIFITPFIRIYTQGIDDIQYVNKYLPYLFVATFLLSNCRYPSNNIINFAGKFKETQWRAVMEALINVVISLVCVSQWGMYGVLVGTIVSLAYRTNDMILYSHHKILGDSAKPTYRRCLINLALFAAFVWLGKIGCSLLAIGNYVSIFLWAILCCLVAVPVFIIFTIIPEKSTYTYGRELLRSYMMKCLNKHRKE